MGYDLGMSIGTPIVTVANREEAEELIRTKGVQTIKNGDHLM